MSITISNCDQICRSPTNKSLSKMLYSFPKSARFNSRKVIHCDKFYDLPSSLAGARTTSMGFGNKYDFTHEAPSVPPPNKYNLKSTFQPNKTVGFGFGKGREEMQVTGPLLYVKKNINPGPGTYVMPSTVLKSSFTLRGKGSEPQPNQVPGPGSYPVPFCINEKGTYFLAKYKSSCVRNFSHIADEQPHVHNLQIPGPGTYDMSKINLSPQGRYASSKLHNCLSRKFGVSIRKPLADLNDVPGPGNYQMPSEFGHYINKKDFEKSNKHDLSENIPPRENTTA